MTNDILIKEMPSKELLEKFLNSMGGSRRYRVYFDLTLGKFINLDEPNKNEPTLGQPIIQGSSGGNQKT